MIADFISAWRTLQLPHNRGFTLASILTLALGIGALTAIFSVVHTLLLAPLPFRDASRLVHLGESNLARSLPEYAVSTPNFVSWTEQAHSFASLSAMREDSANVGDTGDVEQVAGMVASANLWQTLGQPLVLGRAFSVTQGSAAGEPVVIISEGLWKRRYNADANLLGRAIRINGQSRILVGIAAQDVGFRTNVDVWLPLQPDVDNNNRNDRRLDVLGRLVDGVSLEQAGAELEAIATHLEQAFPDSNRDWRVHLLPLRNWIVGDAVRDRLQLLLAAVVVLLLVACTNVANLQIARAIGRAREIGVRQALGATRARLLRQMLIESLTLAAAGGAAGIALAQLAVQTAAATLPSTTPRLAALAIDMPVAIVAVVVTALTAIGFGIAPALVAARLNVSRTLAQAGRSALGSRHASLRQALVVIQFALATTLMIGAGVLLQNFSHLQNVNLGFRSDHLLTASLHLPQVDESASIEANWAIYRQLLEDARALPGVVSVGLTNGIPMGPLNTSMEIGPITPTSSPSDKGIQTSWRIATSDYLTTLDIPLRGGRLFDANREPRNSILLSEGLAKRLWPNGEDAVGHRVWLGNGQLFNVIGVVGDVRQLGVAQDLTPTVYLPTSWYLWPTMTLVLRTSADPIGVIGPLREMARGISPDQPLFDIRPMSSVIAADVAQPRLQTSLLIAFAAISLLLAAFGVAGVIAYLVARRTPELALRMALGASTQSVLRHVLGQGGMLCALGVGVGVVLALAIGRLFASSIGSEGVNLPLTLILTTGSLFAAGLLACWLPALRATRISPSAALRAE